jgi:hypothetical protein
MDNRNGGEEAAIPGCASSAAQSDFEGNTRPANL